MSVWNNIRSVAKYERKLLLRTWFYRVFLVLSVLIWLLTVKLYVISYITNFIRCVTI